VKSKKELIYQIQKNIPAMTEKDIADATLTK
jgi:hypothetical protein